MADPLGPIVEGRQCDQLGDELATSTLGNLVRAALLPRPPLVDWAGWRNWSREFGCRPPEPPQSAGMKSAWTTREGALYRALMLDVYGDDWKQQLRTQTEEAQFSAEMAADLAAGAASDAREKVRIDLEQATLALEAARKAAAAMAAEKGGGAGKRAECGDWT